MTSTGDDDLINTEEKGDLEYRKTQLERLQNEVVDIEEMQSGISIMDLGLNEFRQDLMGCLKAGGAPGCMPFGLHAVVPAVPGCPPGAVFVLKSRGGASAGNRNRLHPFCLVYVADGGEVVSDHLSPKDTLDALRLLCKGKAEPILALCKAFNAETKDGKDMRKYSALLGEAIASVIDAKSRSEMDSFLSGGQVSFLSNRVSGSGNTIDSPRAHVLPWIQQPYLLPDAETESPSRRKRAAISRRHRR
jgi:hypothetical protein